MGDGGARIQGTESMAETKKKSRGILSVEEISEKLSSLFADENLRLVLLFGSAASGKTHAESDVDLGFLFNEPADILSLTNLVIRLLRTDKVDVVDLRRAGPLLGMSAIRTGKVLYERNPGMYGEFCSLAFRMYADTKKFRQARETVIQKFLEKRRTA